MRIIRRQMPALRAEYRVRTIGLFGSYVRAEQHKRSDLDVLVEFDEAPSLLKFMELEEHLSELTGTKVDLVSRRGLKPHIGEHILKEVVYA